MVSIQSLAEQYGISEKTVKRTIESCGLDAKQDWSEEELTRFDTARRLLTEEGKNYREVAAHFGIAPTVPETSEPEDSGVEAGSLSADAAELAQAHLGALKNQINLTIAQTISSLVEEGVKEVAEFVPALLAQELNRSFTGGQLQELLERSQQQQRNGHSRVGSAGVDFLLGKIQGTPLAIEGRQGQQQLPAASSEQSLKN
jgi:hypothetical protein